MSRDVPRIKASETHRHAVRRLLRESRMATLATVLPDGTPYASLVTVATDVDGSPILLLSALADHTRNLMARPRLSLLVDQARHLPNPQTGPRASLQGTAERVTGADLRARLERRFLARHPAAALYAGFGDFGFWRVRLERAHYVGGFARAVWIDGGLLLPEALAADVATLEPGVIAHMNDDHAEAVALYARVLCGLPDDEAWRLGAVDPDGLDLTGADTSARLSFDRPLTAAGEVRPRLVELARAARAANL